MNPIVTAITEAAEQLTAGASPGSVLPPLKGRLSVARTSQKIDLDQAEAVRWLAGSAKVCIAAGRMDWAAKLAEAAQEMNEEGGAVVPSSWWFGWLDSIPEASTTVDTAEKATSAPASQGPLVIASMPVRVHRLIRDEQGRPLGSVEMDMPE